LKHQPILQIYTKNVDDFDVDHMYELGRQRPQHDSRKLADFGSIPIGKVHFKKKKMKLSELAATVTPPRRAATPGWAPRAA
jgi:hypothetical protein